MAHAGQRKCLNCGLYFTPDRRVGDRQRYCSAGTCQQVSKATSQQRWRSQPANQDYFRGPVHVARVQAWRAAHPGYARRAPGSDRYKRSARHNPLILNLNPAIVPCRLVDRYKIRSVPLRPYWRA
jgi:hypothetical protein